MTTKHIPTYSHAAYLEEIFPTDKLRRAVKVAAKILARYEFDAIAFRGMSGALLGPPLALKLDKALLMVRKNSEYSHSGRNVEGDKAAESYVIIDDFISSGDTVRTIVDSIEAFAPKAVCIGVLEVSRLMEYKGQEFGGLKLPEARKGHWGWKRNLAYEMPKRSRKTTTRSKGDSDVDFHD